MAWSFAALLSLSLLLLGLHLTLGSVSVPPGEALAALAGRLPGTDAAVIVREIRLPRAAAAGLLGGALALSGFLLQTLFANPIAGPFVLGISAGAKLMVALLLVFCLSRGVSFGSGAMVAAALAGSLLALGVTLPLSRRMRRTSGLVVCGVMVGYACSALTDLTVEFADDANIVNLRSWAMGSFAGIRWDGVRVIAAVVCVGTLWAVLLAKPMDAWRLGAVYARNLGVDTRRLRLELILLSSLLSACVTAFAGPVSFVGVAVPHLMRRLLGTSRPLVLVPACFLGGADFCLLCDLLARTLFAPRDISASTMTALLGAPVALWAAASRRR